MNRSGRMFGGVLIGIALLWIFQMAGALPFRNRTTNQLAASPPQDRPPVESANAPRTGTANFGTKSASPSTGTQSFRADSGTSPANSGAASPGTTAGSTTSPNRPTAQPATTNPALPALW